MSDSNNNFDDLQRLLKLKRHETPPPGYFHHFSGDILTRIRAGEGSEPQNLLGRLESSSPFMARLLRLFEAKPGLIGATATALCVMLVFGVVWADRPDAMPDSGNVAAQTEAAQIPQAPTPSALIASAPLAPSDDSGIAIATNPVTSLQPVSTLFGSSQNPLFQSTAFGSPSH